MGCGITKHQVEPISIAVTIRNPPIYCIVCSEQGHAMGGCPGFRPIVGNIKRTLGIPGNITENIPDNISEVVEISVNPNETLEVVDLSDSGSESIDT